MKLSSSEDNLAAATLLKVISRPTITINELHLTEFDIFKTPLKDLKEVIYSLSRKGLLHISRAQTGREEETRLYSFSQIPFFHSENKESQDVNAVIKGLEPHYLSIINDYFSNDEKKNFHLILDSTQRQKDKTIDLDSVESEYGKIFARKLPVLASNMKPFLEIDKNFESIRIPKTTLAKVIIDLVDYSLISGCEALDQYSQTISDIISKHGKIREKMEADASVLTEELLKTGLKKLK